MDDEGVSRLLASIDRRLALLTAEQERSLRKCLAEKLLRTDARVAMFDAIDGRHGSTELARVAGVGERAAQMFIKELLDLDLVRANSAASNTRAVIVERNEDAIVQWYLRQAPQ